MSRSARIGRWLKGLLIAGLMGLAGVPSPAQTLHAILVADTNDPLLANACQHDIEVMQRQFAQVASAIRYDLDEQLVSREAFTRRQLDTLISRLAVQPDDIIFLYYTGHGYNTTARSDPFPMLLLTGDPARAGENIGLLALHEQLRQKKARFCVTLGDCCNNIALSTRGMVGRGGLLRGLTLTDDSLNVVYRKLFLDTRGDVLIASSQPPQQSCAHPDSGSFYTRAFDEALELASRYNRTVSWKTLLNDTQMRLTRHSATRDKRSIYRISQPGAVPVMTAFAAPTRLPAGQPLPAVADMARVNRYLNELTDETLPEPQRYALLNRLTDYFTRHARINIYVNATLGEVQPIEQVVRRLYLNASHIQRINLIERLSAVGPDGLHYRRAAIQEVW